MVRMLKNRAEWLKKPKKASTRTVVGEPAPPRWCGWCIGGLESCEMPAKENLRILRSSESRCPVNT